MGAPLLVSASARLYRLALRAYPRAFRRRVGDDLVEVFADLCAAALRDRGVIGLAPCWGRALRDVAHNASAERLAGWRRRRSGRPPRTPTQLAHPRRETTVNLVGQDLRYAMRTLRQQPGFSLTVIFVLALGIAGTTGIFTIFNGLFLRPLPFPEPDRLMNVDETAPQWNLEFVSVNYNDFRAWRDRNETFESMAVFDEESVNLSLGGEARRVEAVMITPDIFDVLRIEPALGRRFLAEEDEPGAEGVVLLGNALWRDSFAADDAVLGRSLLLDGEPYTVIGVLPPEAVFIDGELWTPLRADPAENQGSWWLNGLGRLRPEVTVEEARLDLERIHRGMVEERPVNEVTSPVVIPVVERLLGEFRLGMVALLAGLSVVLVIACANVAGLMLARSTARAREVGIRVALGAGRRRLVQQLLTESLLLASVGTLVGVALGHAGVRAGLAAAPDDIPRWIAFDLDARFLLFTVGVTVGSALVFGLAPALGAVRVNLQGALQAGDRRTAGAGTRRSLDALVVGEIALALALLVGAGLFMTGFQRLQQVDAGFVADDVLSYRVSLSGPAYEEAEARRTFFRDHLAAVAAMPGVVDVGATTSAPLGGHLGNFFEGEGAAPRGEGEPHPVTLTRWVTDDYFRALGINVRTGRTFTPADAAEEAPPVVIVNETFAEHYWPGQDPVGKRIATNADDPNWITVVGLTQDVKHYGLDEQMRPGVYLPYERSPRPSLTIVARTGVDPLSLVDAVRRDVRDRDPGLPVFDVATMRQTLDESLWPRRAASWTLAIFAGVAVALAVSGIYGVLSYAVGQRTRELGIRMALGARRAQVIGDVLRHGITLMAVGIVVGLTGTYFAARTVAALLVGVSPTDVGVYAGVTLLLVAVAFLANFIPARRAASIDPVTALRD